VTSNKISVRGIALEANNLKPIVLLLQDISILAD
jgi:hypothetical protein